MLDEISEEFLDHLREKHSWPSTGTDKPYSMSTDWQPCQECEYHHHRLAMFKVQSFVISLVDVLLLLAALGYLVMNIESKGLFWGILDTTNCGLAIMMMVFFAANAILFSNKILRRSLTIYCVHLREVDDPINCNTGAIWVTVATALICAGIADTKQYLSSTNRERAVMTAMWHAFWFSCFLQIAIFPIHPTPRVESMLSGENAGKRQRQTSWGINFLARLNLLLLITTQSTISVVSLALLSLNMNKFLDMLGFFIGIVGIVGLVALLINQWLNHLDSLFDLDEVMRRVMESMRSSNPAREAQSA